MRTFINGLKACICRTLDALVRATRVRKTSRLGLGTLELPLERALGFGVVEHISYPRERFAPQ